MITLGTDPEFMLKDEKGRLISAIEVVPGSKENRYDLGNGHFAYFDNVLAECSVKPGGDKQAIIANLKDCFQRYAELVSPLILWPLASANYPDKECEHHEAKQFGCSPELCAYEMTVIRPPECPATFRSCGGHVHIGYNGGADIEDDEEANFKVDWDRVWVIRMADLFLGIPSLILDKDPTSKARRQLYGGAGSHRACSEYGVEYRALSNFWLARPSLVGLIYDLSSACVQTVMEDGCHEQIWDKEINPLDLKETINSANKKKANKYFDLLKKYLPKKVFDEMLAESDKDFDPDMYKNWAIKS